MFDLDIEVRRWRERQERKSSLSPRELDELEDHLRARVDLELELNRVLAPERAFAIARRGLGRPAALEKEFARAGKPRWRRWLVVGWAMFAVSCLTGGLVLPSPMVLVGPQVTLGVAVAVLTAYLSPFTNLLMLATLLELRPGRPRRTRWMAGLASFAAVLNFEYMVAWANPFMWLTPGAVATCAWTASFFCVAAALWMRARELKPATPKPIGGSTA